MDGRGSGLSAGADVTVIAIIIGFGIEGSEESLVLIVPGIVLSGANVCTDKLGGMGCRMDLLQLADGDVGVAFGRG